MFKKLKSLRQAFIHIDSRTIYFYSFVIGCLTGLVSILFHSGIRFLTEWLFEDLARLPIGDAKAMALPFQSAGEAPIYLLILLIPAVGGLLVGVLTHYWGPEAAGSGIDNLLDDFHNHAGQMRKRTAFAKFVASTLTISTGGSAGKEGPMALIGAGLGSLYGKVIKMGARARRTLLLAGAAGGLGAIFRAPLGGAITAVEVLYREDFEADALLPCIISSVTAYTIYSSAMGFGHHLSFETELFHSPMSLLFYAVLGLFCSGAGFVFIRIYRMMHDRVFSVMKLHPILKPALGGFFVGIIGLFFPQAIGEGLAVIQGLIDGDYTQNWMIVSLFFLALALFKMVATSLTIQSGGSGGVLIPSLLIGAALGSLFGTVSHQFFPELVPSVTPFVVVGMAAFFASVTHASLAALVMVTELTGGYELLPPLMLVAFISLITSGKQSLYHNQVTNKFSSQAHLWDMNPMNLQHSLVAQAFGGHYHRQGIIPQTMTWSEIEAETQRTQQTDFIIENEQHELVGLLSLKDLAQLDEDLSESKAVMLAQDLISRKLYYVTEQDSLYLALKYLADSDFDKLPVVRKEDEEHLHLLGYLRHQDILQYYYRMGMQKSEGLT